MPNAETIIPVKYETRDRLRALKREGETYDRLLDRALRPLERRREKRDPSKGEREQGS